MFGGDDFSRLMLSEIKNNSNNIGNLSMLGLFNNQFNSNASNNDFLVRSAAAADLPNLQS